MPTAINVQPAAWDEQTLHGLEAVLKYGGLVLNDRSTPDRFYLTSIEGLFSMPDIRMEELDRIDDHRSYDSFAFFGGRNITLAGRVEAFTLSKMREMVYELRQAFANISREGSLYIYSNFDSIVRYIKCRKVGAITLSEEQRFSSMYIREFSIPLRASDPRILDLQVKTVTSVFSTGSGTTATVENKGNFPAWMRFQIGNAATSVTNPKITGEGRSDGFYYEGTVTGSTSSHITFDPRKRTMVNQRGVYVPDRNWLPATTNSYYGGNFAWPDFYENASTLKCICSSQSGAPTVIIYWQDTWV